MDYGSLIGGIIGGLFTYLGVLATIRSQEKTRLHMEEENKKQQIKEAKEKEEQLIKQAIEERPRLECINYGEFKKLDVENLKKYDLDVIITKIVSFKKDTNRYRFSYSDKVMDKKNWSHVEYEFRNIGHTEISHLFISTNFKKETALFSAKGEINRFHYINELLNYSECLDKFIKPGEIIKVNISYLDNEILSGMHSAAVTLWLVDINGRYWQQPLFAPGNKIYDSNLTDRKTFRSEVFIDDALRCFDNPYLW